MDRQQALYTAMDEGIPMHHAFRLPKKEDDPEDIRRDEAKHSDLAFSSEKALELDVADIKVTDHPGLGRQDMVFVFINNIDNLLFRCAMIANEIPYCSTGYANKTEIRFQYQQP